MGKSRQIEEYVRHAGERAQVLRGRCLPYGDGITFWPIAEALRQAAGIAFEDRDEGRGPSSGRSLVKGARMPRRGSGP